MIKQIFVFFWYVAACLFATTSCTKTTDCCINIDTAVQVLYKNEAGESLINSTDEYDEADIKVYYLNGSEFEYVYDGNLDAPNMHRVDEDGNGELVLTIYPSTYYAGTRSTTLIELNDTVKDTLVGEFDINGNNVICTKSWLNGIEMENRYIEVER